MLTGLATPNTNNFIAIDPGAKTGLAIYNCNALCHYETITYKNAIDYQKAFFNLKEQYRIKFAIIEKYQFFGKVRRQNAYNVVTYEKLLREVFESHINVLTAQWNNQKWRDLFKIALVKDVFGINQVDCHAADAICMGMKIWQRAVPGQEFESLLYLARTKKNWPTAKNESLHRLWENRKECYV